MIFDVELSRYPRSTYRVNEKQCLRKSWHNSSSESICRWDPTFSRLMILSQVNSMFPVYMKFTAAVSAVLVTSCRCTVFVRVSRICVEPAMTSLKNISQTHRSYLHRRVEHIQEKKAQHTHIYRCKISTLFANQFGWGQPMQTGRGLKGKVYRVKL